MVCATEVYKWFKELLPFNRIDFLCSMMQLCLPSELRFIGTLLDDMNNKDYANLREAEDRSDIPNEFRQYPVQPFNAECIRKLCLSLSLLKSTNQKVGQIIYEILQIHSEYANTCVKSKDECSNEILLLYALASYHPAFTFENRYKIGKYFQRMLHNFKESSDDFSNKNNSCCYDVTYRDYHEIDNFQILIKDVKVENLDANITLEIVTKHNRNLVAKKSTTFSKIMQLFKKTAETNNGKRISKLTYEISNLTRNGNFTNANISEVLEKVIKFMESSASNDDTSLVLKDFFLHLAKSCHSNYYKSENRNFESPVVLDDTDSTLSKKSSLKYIFQNNNYDGKSLETLKAANTAKRSVDIEETCSVSDVHKSAVVSVDRILKDRLYSEVVTNDCHQQHHSHHHSYQQQQHQQQQQQQFEADIGRSRLVGGKSQETVDSSLTDSSDRTAISDNTSYPDVNSHIPVFQYYLPHYSVLSTSKSNSSLSHYPQYSSNSMDHVSSPIPTNNNNTLMRSIVPDALILTHCPQRFLPLNPHFSPLVPVLCPLNSSANFVPMNDMNFDLFQSHRLAPSANISSSPTVANKLVSSSSSSSSSSIPPRLQSNHQKSSSCSSSSASAAATTLIHQSNFNGS